MRLQPSRAREHLGALPARVPAVLCLGSSGFHASLAPGYIILRYLFVVLRSNVPAWDVPGRRLGLGLA